MITKEDLAKMTDGEVLDLVKKAQGHTKEMQDFLNCDFSYTHLTNELKRRGWTDGWHKPVSDPTDMPVATVCTPAPERVVLKPPTGKTIRKTLTLSEDTAERWTRLASRVPYKSALVDAAFDRLLKAYEDGLVTFSLDI